MTSDLSHQLTRALRSVAVLFVLALVLPAGCHTLFARQASKLDALADHGVQLEAMVSRIDAQRTVFLDYTLDAKPYAWNISLDEAPDAVAGRPLVVAVLPEEPTTLVVGDKHRAADKAIKNRAFAWRVDLGLFWFFGFGAALGTWQYQRMKRTGLTERDDPNAYRTRLVLSGIWLAPFLVMTFGHHWLEGQARGESPWAAALGVVLCVGLLGAIGYHLLREGQSHVAQRGARLVKWAVPLAVFASAIRLVLWLIADRN